MKSARAFLFASALTALSAAPAPADDYPVKSDSLYHAMAVMTRLADKKVRAELGLSPEQDKAVVAVVNGRWNQWFRDVTPQELAKITGPDRDARVRALFTQRADETFAAAGKVLDPGQIARLKQILLQEYGITLFDYPEVRQALKLDRPQVKKLREAHEKLRAEVGKEIASGKMARAEARRRWDAVTFGVPGRVREVLTDDQRKKLAELLGKPFAFNE
jgi:hypothetical protein